MTKLTPLEFVNALRTEEINSVIARHNALFAGKDALEIGSGAGAQLLLLRRICSSAVGIENSIRADRLTDIVPYDGKSIPFPDSSFDVVFSSNVLEHIKDQKDIHAEMHRVLRPTGICVHIVPTAAWRLWLSILHYPALVKKIADKLTRSRNIDATATEGHGDPAAKTASWRERLSYILIQRPHGELGNWWNEHFLFRVGTWRKRFETHGWRVEAAEPVGFLVSGHYLLNERLSWNARRRLAKIFGSSS